MQCGTETRKPLSRARDVFESIPACMRAAHSRCTTSRVWRAYGPTHREQARLQCRPSAVSRFSGGVLWFDSERCRNWGKADNEPHIRGAPRTNSYHSIARFLARHPPWPPLLASQPQSPSCNLISSSSSSESKLTDHSRIEQLQRQPSRGGPLLLQRAQPTRFKFDGSFEIGNGRSFARSLSLTVARLAFSLITKLICTTALARIAHEYLRPAEESARGGIGLQFCVMNCYGPLFCLLTHKHTHSGDRPFLWPRSCN